MILIRWFVVFGWCAMLFLQMGGPASAGRARTSDGVSPSYRNQMWRISGRLVANRGGAFLYSATFFRYAEPNGVVLYPASISVVDESTGRLFSKRRIERADLGLADATTGTLAVRVGSWRLRESFIGSAAPTFELDARFDGVALSIRGPARKPRFALRSATTEYDEYSSVASKGTIEIYGRRLPVGGTSWLDHELSNVAASATAPFAQLRVQLDDGREIFIETSDSAGRRGPHRRAFLIERDGTIDKLDPSSYQFGEHPGSTWLSPHTRVVYPDVWALHVDDKTESLSLEPVSYEQESLTHGAGLPFWDGAVDVYDVTPGSQGLRLGSGYVLMYGYPVERTVS